jgi:undecaprenyl-diphosphatase
MWPKKIYFLTPNNMSFAQIIKNIFFLLVSVFSGVTLILVSVGVSSTSGLAPFNSGVEEIFTHLRTPFLTNFMLITTNLGSPLILSLLAIVLSVVIILRRDLYDTLLYAISILSAILLFNLMQNGFALPRPDASLITGLSGWNFPSGNAAVATAFFFATGYSFFDWPKNWANRTLLVFVCVVGALLVVTSRLYLGTHFALDVLAGVCVGLLSVSLTILIFNMFLSERRFWRQTLRGL